MLIFEFPPQQRRRQLGGDKKIHLIDRGNEFATDQEFLQTIAVAESLIVKNAFPKIWDCGAGFELFGEVCRRSHPGLFSNGNAASVCANYGLVKSKGPLEPDNGSK